MRADLFELEAHGGAGAGFGDGDFEIFREDFGLRYAFGGGDAAEHSHELAALIAEDVFVPGNAAAVCAVELGFIGGEMAEAEVFVGHGEEGGSERFGVGFSFAADVAGAPAAVDQLPFAIVDFDGVPGVVGMFGWDGRAR